MLFFISDQEQSKNDEYNWGEYYASYDNYRIIIFVSGVGNNVPFSNDYDFPPRYYGYSEGEKFRWVCHEDDREFSEKEIKEIEQRKQIFYDLFNFDIAKYSIRILDRSNYKEICESDNILGLDNAKTEAGRLLKEHITEKLNLIIKDLE